MLQLLRSPKQAEVHIRRRLQQNGLSQDRLLFCERVLRLGTHALRLGTNVSTHAFTHDTRLCFGGEDSRTASAVRSAARMRALRALRAMGALGAFRCEREPWLGRLLDPRDNLRRMGAVDVGLDTVFGFNGHTTAADTMWAGVPLVTMAWYDAAALGAERRASSVIPARVNGGGVRRYKMPARVSASLVFALGSSEGNVTVTTTFQSAAHTVCRTEKRQR